MRILGIHYGHDSNAGIIEDGEVLYAISEERLNRKKFHRGFPFLSISSALNYCRLQPDDIDILAVVNLNAQEETLGGNLKNFYTRINRPVPWPAHILSAPISAADNILGLTLRRSIAKKKVRDTLRRLGFNPEKVRFVDHHLAHAAGAFFLSGFEEALVFTSDGKGDHISHGTYLAGPNVFKKLHESRAFDSVGFFYTCITAYLGFKKLRHEGKITGLAAYGTFDKVKHIKSPIGPNNELTEIRNFLISEKEAKNIYRVYVKMLKENPKLLYQWITSYSAVMAEYSQYCFEKYFKTSFDGMSREHVAAFAQKHLENTVTTLVDVQVSQYGTSNVCLSGGTFGNVRLNQKISQLKGVKSVYIQPAMADTGLGVGGALWEYWRLQSKWNHRFLSKVFLGPEFSDQQIVDILKRYDLNFERIEDIEKHIALLLWEGKIIGRYTGRMEWGPRALGNRSILVTATDDSINQTLNKRLKRTEFMPFAPIILEEYASQYFKGYNSQQPAPRFMTITYDVFESKKSQIPAVVHVDGTARPQVVRMSDNPSLYKVLTEYHRLSNIPVLINTSFNMHEEPIVCTPDDAVRSFLQGAVDLLAIENYLVKK